MLRVRLNINLSHIFCDGVHIFVDFLFEQLLLLLSCLLVLTHLFVDHYFLKNVTLKLFLLCLNCSLLTLLLWVAVLLHW